MTDTDGTYVETAELHDGVRQRTRSFERVVTASKYQAGPDHRERVVVERLDADGNIVTDEVLGPPQDPEGGYVGPASVDIIHVERL